MMKYVLLAVFLLAGITSVFGQDEKQEDVKRLAADVESLIAANATMQKKMSQLVDELRSIRDEQKSADRSTTMQAIQEDLKRLADKIHEVDKKRIADKELIAEELDKIQKYLKTSPAPNRNAKGSSRSEPEREKATSTDKGYEYVVQKGDLLPTIIKEYNAEFKKKGMRTITTQQVIEANPGLNPSKLRAGQKLFIPMPQ